MHLAAAGFLLLYLLVPHWPGESVREGTHLLLVPLADAGTGEPRAAPAPVQQGPQEAAAWDDVLSQGQQQWR